MHITVEIIEAGPLGMFVLRLLAALNCFQNRLFIISILFSHPSLPIFAFPFFFV